MVIPSQGIAEVWGDVVKIIQFFFLQSVVNLPHVFRKGMC